MNNLLLRHLVLIFLSAALLAGCASFKGSDRDALEQRVDAYYDALIAGDYRSAYGFFTPGHRKRFGFEQHYQVYPPIARYKEAKVLERSCSTESACRVEVLATIVFRTDMKELDGQRSTTTIPERWVRVDGQWWLLPPR